MSAKKRSFTPLPASRAGCDPWPRTSIAGWNRRKTPMLALRNEYREAKLPTLKEEKMPARNRCLAFVPLPALVGVPSAALAVAAQAAEYKMTVNRDRLIKSENEPQNWLMMNGDYGSMRYSKLAQINRDNVKNLHMVWALALRGMQDIRQEGPGKRGNPVSDHRL